MNRCPMPRHVEAELRFVSRMLDRDTVVHTANGLALWERQARVNLLREAGQLSASSW